MSGETICGIPAKEFMDCVVSSAQKIQACPWKNQDDKIAHCELVMQSLPVETLDRIAKLRESGWRIEFGKGVPVWALAVGSVAFRVSNDKHVACELIAFWADDSQVSEIITELVDKASGY